MVLRSQIECGKDSTIYRDEMRCKLNHHLRAGSSAQFLLNFRKMPVLGNTVRPDTFIALDEKVVHLRLAPGTTDTTHRISNDAGWFDDSSPQQRQGRQQNAGWITSGRGNERRLFDG